MKTSIRILLFTWVIAVSPAYAEDEPRDFYSEPGWNSFKETGGQDMTENIDPFSGNLQLGYVDITIPGNGGLDLRISRFYNLPQSLPSYTNPYGYGWTMHFGRITIGSAHVTDLCQSGDVVGGDTKNNPSIEMPDGGREMLFPSSVPGDGIYITKSNWKAECIDPADYTQGVVVTAPNGTRYFMGVRVYSQGEDGPTGEAAPFVETWFTSHIEDLFGNSIDISYLAIGNGMKLISQISTSDGRQVDFRYLDENDQIATAASNDARLSEIEANGHYWRYYYEPMTESAAGWGGVGHHRLIAVERPDGSKWRYDYGAVPGEIDYDRLVKITYPFGAEILYSYQKFKPYAPRADFEIIAVASKIQNNPGQPSGTWGYSFEPGTIPFENIGPNSAGNIGRLADRTVITTPSGIEHLYHVGYWAMVGRLDVLWQMGLKLRHDLLEIDSNDGTQKIVRTVLNTWGFRAISNEEFRQGILTDLWDDAVYAPVLISEYSSINGFGTRVDYSNHDAFGNPQTIVEYSNFESIGDRVTAATYLNDTDKWLIGLPETESFSQDEQETGSISRTFHAFGRIETENKFGVLTRYSYTSEGDLAVITDARNNSTTYSDYYRGIPQLENYPDGTAKSRIVNDSGTVAAETSGRGNSTAFGYDSLNRLTSIDYPLGNDVAITYTDNSKTLSRGDYRESVEWDGFGRQLQVVRSDIALAANYIRTFRYDELGRKVFESDTNSSSGISLEYDVLDRIVKIINQDGTDKEIVYEGAYREIHIDENGNQTDYRYQLFGKADKKYLKDIISPEGVATFIDRDVHGNILTVFQGGADTQTPGQYWGYSKNFSYDSHFFLTSINSPADIGLTTFTRDAVGNLTSKKVAASNTVFYEYDGMDRLVLIDYQDDSIDVSNSYDADGNISKITNSFGRRTYSYDNNGNLVAEDVRIGDNNYQVSYLVDGQDYVERIIYPSGRTIDFSPDALGRPTRALPYLTLVLYFPNGSLQKLEYANGESVSFEMTDRNWIDTITVSGAMTLASLDYNYDGTGNIIDILDLLDSNKNRTMTYDNLHRLQSVNGNWGISEFEYDAFSNITQKSDPARNNRNQILEYSGMLLNKVTYSGTSSQRIFTYDEFGNASNSDDIVYDIVTGLPVDTLTTRQYGFNDAGNLTSSVRQAENGSGIAVPIESGSFEAFYDGKNNRIRKINHFDGNRETDYLYSDTGLLLGEYDHCGTYFGQEHFYLGTHQVATAKYNSPPIADAGEDQLSYGGLTVNIVGTDSDADGTIISRQWRQIGGPAVNLISTYGHDIHFTAPELPGDEIVVLEYRVDDDKNAAVTDQVEIVIISNHPPVANAGPDQNVVAGQPVMLDGTLSTDLEGPVQFNWSGFIDLDDPTSPTPSFFPVDTGHDSSHVYQLIVTDTAGVRDFDHVLINIFSPANDSDQDGLDNAWEITNFGDDVSFNGEDDPDGDGVSNRQEYFEGTDPNVANTVSSIDRLKVLQGDGENTLVWEKIPATTEYRIFWSTDQESDIAAWNQATTLKTHFRHNNLTNGITYYYLVTASNSLGESAFSPLVHGVPDTRQWSLPIDMPDSPAAFDSNKTILASNAAGDQVVLSEKFESNSYRLYAWRYGIFDGWSEAELVNESDFSHRDFRIDIGDDGEILAVWAEKTNSTGTYDLFSAYRAVGSFWQQKMPVEDYDATSNIDGNVVGVSHLEFTESGEAFLCWRQNIEHVFQNYFDPDGASALVKTFHPRRGWIDEHHLEVLNNVGDTIDLRCDVSGNGRVLAAWTRKESFSPAYLVSTTIDTWVAAHEPESGWLEGETVEFLENQIREDFGSDIRNANPRTTVSDTGTGLVVWYDGSNEDIESIEFDYGSFAWLKQLTLESRDNQIPGSNTHEISSNSRGDFVVKWGDKFTTKLSGQSKWSRANSLPSGSNLLGIDEYGSPFSVNATGSGITFNRFANNAWMTQVLNDPLDVRIKTPLLSIHDYSNNPHVYWLSEDDLYGSVNTPPESTPSGNQVPKAIAGADQVVPGSTYVQLDGSDSYDFDGFITDYLWQQTSGIPVTLDDALGFVSSFYSPDVSTEEQLVFQLTVTDDQGAEASDSTTVTVLFSEPDLVPPITTFSSQRKMVKGRPKHAVTLSANEAGTTHYRFSGQGSIIAGGVDTPDWQIYSGAVEIQLDKNGTGYFDFYTEDLTGNVEMLQMEVLQ